MSNWKTTLGGVVAGAAVLLVEFGDLLGIPVTAESDGVFQLDKALAGLTAIGMVFALFHARDSKKGEE